MVYVPITPHIPPQQVSLEAQELTRQIESAIAAYQEDHPRATQVDVQQALQLAQSRAGSDAPKQRIMVVIALLTGLAVAFTMGLWLLAR